MANSKFQETYIVYILLRESRVSVRFELFHMREKCSRSHIKICNYLFIFCDFVLIQIRNKFAIIF